MMGKQTNLIIGGPGRSGKTTITSVIKNENDFHCIALPVEGIIDKYYERPYRFPNLQKKSIIADYLYQPRFIDERRIEYDVPAKYFVRKIDDILKGKIPDVKHHIELIFWLLEVYAKDHFKEHWAVCDLHSECYFKVYKKFLPYLRLLLIYRDPIESICAQLYWRKPLQKRKINKQHIEFEILSWILSLVTAWRLKTDYPDDVYIYSITDLISKKTTKEKFKAEIGFSIDNKIETALAGKPWFNFKNNKFFMPDNSYRSLLGEEEIDFIIRWTTPVYTTVKKNDNDFNPIKFPKGHFLGKLTHLIELIERNPVHARKYCSKYNPVNLSGYAKIPKEIKYLKMAIKYTLRPFIGDFFFNTNY